MGLARATKVKELLLAEVPNLNPELLTVTSAMIDEPADARKGKFVATKFLVNDKADEGTVEIIEVDNTITILFPYAQSISYLRVKTKIGLASRLVKTDETVAITGHTDDSGTIPFNQELGMARAKHIQDILISKGIKGYRLSIASKGELEPVADNATEEGSRLNRRAVLVLNKKPLNKKPLN